MSTKNQNDQQIKKIFFFELLTKYSLKKVQFSLKTYIINDIRNKIQKGNAGRLR